MGSDTAYSCRGSAVTSNTSPSPNTASGTNRDYDTDTDTNCCPANRGNSTPVDPDAALSFLDRPSNADYDESGGG